ncbi:hypothetical protein P171DRAFT_448193 [Karstenula rhodostoma CBS 690.94]|uniref:EF-hand domain-containing protein n=1 Tax=Karstenula rhodostoma CBS 690.94 TaxID=1392251 RepID=A0A9P4P8J5_9PLEO|nr:hypothetical protein P171DRAFT_448193 [Karstenula rhodostoma CBS 690.94]
MARLSAENSAEHLAALKTPNQKAPRKSSRFKEFFRSSNSHASLGSGHNASPLGASPPGGVENLKPGFEKVGLHPSERSPVSDTAESRPSDRSRLLEEWEELKKKNKELANMQLYKEREELNKREEGEGNAEEEIAMIEKSSIGSDKAMRVLGIERSTEEKKGADIARTTAENRDAAILEVLVQNADQNPSKSLTNDELAEVLHEAYESSTYSPTSSIFAVANTTPSRHPSLRHSPPLDNLRTNAQTQVLPTDSISNIGDALDDESTRANANSSAVPSQKLSYAAGLHDFHFPRFNLIDSDTAGLHTSTTDRFYLNTLVDHDASSTKSLPVTDFKLGPFKVEISTARALTESLLPFTYMVLLFSKAIQGPVELVVALWKIMVLTVAYAGLRRLMCWHEDGSSDVLLAPAEKAGHKVVQYCTQMMEMFVGALAHAILVALRELDAEDDL